MPGNSGINYGALGQQQVKLNGKAYNIVPQQGAYKVGEIPSHFDMDPRMERRVVWEALSGIQRFRDEPTSSADQAATSPYTRDTKGGSGIWWANKCNATIGNRIMAQRATGLSQGTNTTIIRALDGSAKSAVVCLQHVYYLNGTLGGSQQLVEAQDLSPGGNGPATAINLTDVISFNGKLWFANARLTNGLPDPAQAQPMWVWDQSSGMNVGWNELAYNVNNYTPPSGYPNSGGSSDLGHAYAFCVIRGQLWRAAGASVWSWDGLATTWSSPSVIGDPNTEITAIDVFQDSLIIFKTDGIFTMDRAGQTYPLFPGFSTLGFNFRPLCQWQSSYYFAGDFGMVWEYDGTSVTRIGFDWAEPYPLASGQFGILNASTRGIGLPNIMLVGFQEYGTVGGQSYILAYDGANWQPYLQRTGEITALGVTGGNQIPSAPTLQIASQLALYYLTNPQIDPFLATDFDTTAQTFYLPIDSGAFQDEEKVLERVVVLLDNSSTGSIQTAYAGDDNIAALSWTDLGAPTMENGFPGKQTFQVPMDGTTVTPLPTYNKVGIRITILPNTSSASPIVRNVVLHYQQRGPQRRTWDIQLLAEPNVVNTGGTRDNRAVKAIFNDLDSARQTRQQVSFIDTDGVEWQVYVGEVDRDMAVYKAQKQLSYMVAVKLVEATVS